MTLVVLAIVFLLSLVIYSYIKIYAPAKEANERAIQTLENERDVLFALERQEAQQNPARSSNSRPLQQKVPVKPLEDLILLQVQEAEVKSDTYLQEVNFSLENALIDNPPEHVTNVQAVITEVRLQTDSYSKIDRFIEEIESMERIYVMDAVEFSVPGEIRSDDEKVDFLELTVTFHAFYRPDLIELEDEAPKVDAPNPTGKKDPTPINQMPETGENK